MNFLKKTAETKLETEFGSFDFVVYQEKKTGKEHIVLKKSWGTKIPLIRIHSECATGDIFSSTSCDCGPQLNAALRLIAKSGGMIIYLRQEGRGLGLTNKIKAYELQLKGLDTVDANLKLGRGADERSYELAVEILRDLKLSKVKLLTNNPQKIDVLREQGFSVEVVPLRVMMTSERGKKYMLTKKTKMGHLL